MTKILASAAESLNGFCRFVLIVLGLSEGHRVQRAMFAQYYAG